MPDKEDNNLLEQNKPRPEPHIPAKRVLNTDAVSIKRSPYCPHNYPWGRCPKGCK